MESTMRSPQDSWSSHSGSRRSKCAACCEHTCGGKRALPIINCLCCAFGVAGTVVGILRKPDLDSAIRMFSSGSKRFDLATEALAWNWYDVGVLVIICMSFVSAILGGYLQAYVQEGALEESAKYRACNLQLLYNRLVQVLLVLSSVLQLLISYSFLTILVLVIILDATCVSGDSAISKLLELAAFLQDTDETGVSDVFKNVREFCEIDEDVRTAAVHVFAATGLVVASFGPLLACATCTRERICMHLRYRGSELPEAALEFMSPGYEERSLLEKCQSTQTDVVSERKEVFDAASQTSEDQLKQELSKLNERLALQAALLSETQQKLEKAEYELAHQILETDGERRRTDKAENELADLMKMHSRAQQKLHKWRESTTSSTSTTAEDAKHEDETSLDQRVEQLAKKRDELKASPPQATASDRLARFSRAKPSNSSSNAQSDKLDGNRTSTLQVAASDRLARFSLPKVSNPQNAGLELEKESNANARLSTTSELAVAGSKDKEKLLMPPKKPKEPGKRSLERVSSRKSRHSKKSAVESDITSLLGPSPPAPPALPPPSKIPQPRGGSLIMESTPSESLAIEAPAAPWEMQMS